MVFVACWCALAMVESTDSDQSTIPAASAAAVSLARTSSQVPSVAIRRCQVHTVCHGPNDSGRSRHAIPHRYRYTMPSTMVRASENGRPLRPVGRGNISSINDHWASESNWKRDTSAESQPNTELFVRHALAVLGREVGDTAGRLLT